MKAPLPINHIFVDYENMKSVDPSVFKIEQATYTLILGPQNKTLNLALVEQLMARAGSVELVRIEKIGRNAVDFALAYYLGRKVATEPRGFFHLISRDNDYQPLIEHLQTRRVRVTQHKSFEELDVYLAHAAAGAAAPGVKPPTATVSSPPVLKVANPASAPVLEPGEKLRQHLKRNVKARPARKTTLIGVITKQVLKGMGEAEAERLIQQLQKAGVLAINEKGGVTYHL